MSSMREAQILSILRELLEANFDGAAALRLQLDGIRISGPFDADGSVRLDTTIGPAAIVRYNIPVEGTFLDADGVTAHALLHVDGQGRMEELELYKDDGSSVRQLPAPGELTIFTPYSDPGKSSNGNGPG
jgi:uncharacterized protein DUF6984